MNRRDFLRTSGAALGAVPFAGLPFVSGPAYTGRATTTTDVLVYGGGASGWCAAVQAARMGAAVTVVEPSAWIGGMLTAAGVSALDGNKHGAGGGLVHAFREALAAHYGSYEALFTGWISLYCYEPRVGLGILEAWGHGMPNLTVLAEHEVVGYERLGPRERRLRVAAPDGATADHVAEVFVAADEYGDGLALAGLPYRLGREARDELGESAAPDEADFRIQDFTYCATLVRRPGSAPPSLTDVERVYHDRWFACSTTEDCPTPDPDLLGHGLNDWERFITYAALPNDKVLLNWPHHANDFPAPVAFFEDRFYREQHLAASRLHTLQFVRYMQTELGHPEWQIAQGEYPTAHHLPPLPYIRECRRLVNGAILVQDDVVARVGPDGQPLPRAPMQPRTITVGDYFLDHHHAEHHLPPGRRLAEAFPPSAPYQVPLDVCLPDPEGPGDPDVLVGEKAIAVSHIVNGSTRLQPVVMGLGQALGALAALAVEGGRVPRDVDVRRLQATLVDAGAALYIVYDLTPDDPLYRPVQRLALAGVLDAATPTRLAPDEPPTAGEAAAWRQRALEAGAAPEQVPADAPTRRALLAGLDAALTDAA